MNHSYLIREKGAKPITYILRKIIFIGLAAVNSNLKIRSYTNAHFAFRLLHLFCSIGLLIWGSILLIGTLKEGKKRTFTEKATMLLITFLLIILFLSTVDTIQNAIYKDRYLFS